ncbi:MAG: phosphatase PAP2 family protein [Acidimicrobiales bacterium]
MGTGPTGMVGSGPGSEDRSEAAKMWATLRPTLLPLLISFGVLTALWCVIGFGLRSDLAGPLRGFDERTAQRLAESRTETWDSVAFYVAYVADTFVKIGATAVLAGMFWVAWRRWHEPLLLALSLILEAAVFITVTTIVQRPRPDVPKLEQSPIDSSFPSGHTAAAAVYSALAVIVFWHCRHRVWRTLAVVVALVVPAAVGFARAYAGMHAMSDVMGGALLGFACVAVVARLLARPRKADVGYPQPARRR